MKMLKEIFVVMIGSILIGLGINVFIIPTNLVDGGMIGIALLLNYVWNLNVGIALFILSIPIFILVWFYKKSFVYRGFLGIGVTSFIVHLFSTISIVPLFDPLYSALLGGFLLGSGVGFMFLFDVSTDSLDLFALFLSDKFKINIGLMVFILDAFVIGTAFIIVNHQQILLSLIAICAHVCAIIMFNLFKSREIPT
ncbi:YitT family protein [Ammoniphilus sp. CFH 90114]|uniref:YitT family protein n=1 Tax=Ammoniphilus sp. CFH 90114 TaxID=2493665 RepID=UPI00100DD1D0|nr:YitT family protein [Ammoniphilus sp. CFH 90114]RXT06395.1 hypothetical protein EIZ39_15105 [Ammoniphilus sp. CFH 90114]